MYLNIVFHRIAKDNDDVRDHYEVTIDQFRTILNLVRKLNSVRDCRFNRYRLYFDDGDDSFVIRALPYILEAELLNCVLAITTDNIGGAGFLSKKDLILLHKRGVQIASHGVSHSALACYKNQLIQSTPEGGMYQSAPSGHAKVLSRQEVLYQLRESKKTLVEIAGIISEFVLPYGCYNKDVLKINHDYNLYDIISTCDNFLDKGLRLRPRILTRSDMSLSELRRLIMGLKTQ
jgi:hypothetical protein